MYLTQPAEVKYVDLANFNCGHNVPSHESQAYLAYKDYVKTSRFSRSYKVELTNDDVARINKGSNTQVDQTIEAKWTMVYDEGFEIIVDRQEEKSSYFAFSKYDNRSNINKSTLKSNITSKWVSYCYSTLVGWYYEGQKWGCWYASKNNINSDDPTNGEAENKLIVVENTVKAKDDSSIRTLEPTILNRSKTEDKKYLKSQPEGSIFDSVNFLQASERLVLSATFKDHIKVVTRINNDKSLTWKARYYKEFDGLTIKDLNGIAGRRRQGDTNFKGFERRGSDITEYSFKSKDYSKSEISIDDKMERNGKYCSN